MLINMFGILINPNEIAAVQSSYNKRTLKNHTFITLRCGKEIELNDSATLEEVKRKLNGIR